MVETGIKKYDSLPGRVGLSDIDYMRYLFQLYKQQMENVQYQLDEIANNLQKEKRRQK